MPKTMKTEDKILKELQAVKRLLILQLILQGVGSDELGRATEVDSSVIRKMFPIRKIRQR